MPRFREGFVTAKCLTADPGISTSGRCKVQRRNEPSLKGEMACALRNSTRAGPVDDRCNQRDDTLKQSSKIIEGSLFGRQAYWQEDLCAFVLNLKQHSTVEIFSTGTRASFLNESMECG